MKFAYVTKAKIPSTSASSINIMQSCEAITELGIDIKLFYPFKINYPFNVFRNIFEYYGIKKKFKVSKYIPQYSHRASLFYKIVSNKCKREERIVYTRDILFLSYCTEYKLSAIWECHFPPKESYEKLILKTFISSSSFKGIVVITKALKNELCDEYSNLDPEKVIVMADPVNNEKFESSFKKFPEEKKTLSIGYTGSLNVGKGWEIMPLLAKICPEFKFHVFGGEQNKVNVLRKQYSHLDNLIFHGHIPHKKINEALDSFEIGLLPNRPNVIIGNNIDIGKYTSPMKLFEYMAAGKVIIASDISVLKEVLIDNYNCLLVKYDDIEAWKEKINLLDKNRNLFLKIRDEAKNDVIANYTYKGRYSKIIEKFCNG